MRLSATNAIGACAGAMTLTLPWLVLGATAAPAKYQHPNRSEAGMISYNDQGTAQVVFVSRIDQSGAATIAFLDAAGKTSRTMTAR